METFWAPAILWEVAKRAYDAISSRGAPYSADTFLHLYSRAVEDATNLTADLEHMSADELELAIEGTLRLMATLVRSFHGQEDLEVNASLFVPAERQHTLHNVKSPAQTQSPQRYLIELKRAYGDSRKIEIPIAKQVGTSSPTPLAALLSEAPIVISKVAGGDASIFRDSSMRPYRSLAAVPVASPRSSIPADTGQAPIGVVVLESTKPFLIGRFEGNQRKFLLILAPLLQVLGHLANKLEQQNDRPQQGSPQAAPLEQGKIGASPASEPPQDTNRVPQSRPQQPPRVFISYSWDTELHRDWVEELARRLVARGIWILLDRWDTKLGSDLTHYMESSIRKSRRVIVVCTPEYARRANGRKRGAGYETSIISGELYQQMGRPDKFIPLLRHGSVRGALPGYLRSKVFVDFREDSRLEQNVSALADDIFDVPRRPSIPPFS